MSRDPPCSVGALRLCFGLGPGLGGAVGPVKYRLPVLVPFHDDWDEPGDVEEWSLQPLGAGQAIVSGETEKAMQQRERRRNWLTYRVRPRAAPPALTVRERTAIPPDVPRHRPHITFGAANDQNPPVVHHQEAIVPQVFDERRGDHLKPHPAM